MIIKKTSPARKKMPRHCNDHCKARKHQRRQCEEETDTESSSEEEQERRLRSKKHGKSKSHHHHESCDEVEPVVCARIGTTLEFSGYVKDQPPCTPLFLPLGFAAALTAEQGGLNAPPLGSQQDIITGKGFSFEQVVTSDTNCCTVAYHIEDCELKECERYVLTIAQIEQCGPGLCGPGPKSNGYWAIQPKANIALKTVASQDLCGKLAAPFAALTGVETVVAPFKKGSLVAVYLTIGERERCPPDPCECPPNTDNIKNKYNGCGAILVTLSLS